MEFTKNSAYDRYTLKLTVTETATSAVDNTSTLSWSLDLIANTSYWFDMYNVGRTVAINGSTVYNFPRSSPPQIGVDPNSTTNLGSGSGVIVPHNSDGTKTVSVAYSIDMASDSSTPGPLNGSGDMPLTTIARGSALEAVYGFNVNGSIAISITKYSPTFTDNLSILYGSTTIRTISNISSGATISFTSGELATIYGLMSAVNSGAFTFTLNTYLGGTWIGASSRIATGYITDANPTLSASVIDINTATLALTTSNAVLVRYASTAQISITASGAKSATIASKVVNGALVTGDTLTIENVSSAPFTVTVTDTRGNAATVTLNPVVVDYVPLTISSNFYRPAPTTGEVAVVFSGNYFNGNFGSADNTLLLNWYYRESGASEWVYGDLFALGTDYNISGNTFASGEVSLGTGFDYTKNYDFSINAVDSLTSTGNGLQLVTKGLPVFDFGEDDLNINGLFKILGVTQPHVTANGNSGIWHYTVRREGGEVWADCAFTIPVTVPINTVWGNMYRSDILAGAGYPFAYAVPPRVLPSVNGNAIVAVALAGNNTTTATPGFVIYSADPNETAITYELSIFVTGKL